MARLWFAKISGTQPGLVATDDASRALLDKMGDGECAQFEVLRPRSIQWHRRYFATCADIGRNQEPARDADSIDHELRILAGHFEVMKLRDRKSGVLYEVLTPKRIAFHKMSAEEWGDYYKRGEPEWIARFGEGYLLEDAVA